LLTALVVLVAVAAAGCGGGDSGSLTRGNLGATENLTVAQDQADIQEFCNFAQAPTGDLYDRALSSEIPAVDELIIVYKKHTDGTYYDAVKKREIKMKQFLQDQARALNGCGKDGKQQAAKLTQAIQS
jgi:hypothetical protein